MFRRLVSAAGQSRSAKTVEVFGWLILVEGIIVLFALISPSPFSALHHSAIRRQITSGSPDCSCAASACFTS
jgi:hypothetical protein